MKNNILKSNIIAVFFALLLFPSCSRANTKQEQRENIQLNNNTESFEQIEEEKKFLFENDTIKQSIILTKCTDTQIDFLYKIKNLKRDCSITYSGAAFNEYPDNDPELDEDEDGFGYPSIEYLYENEDCIIKIRLSMIEKDKIQIKSNCNQYIFCPANSIGILR